MWELDADFVVELVVAAWGTEKQEDRLEERSIAEPDADFAVELAVAAWGSEKQEDGSGARSIADPESDHAVAGMEKSMEKEEERLECSSSESDLKRFVELVVVAGAEKWEGPDLERVVAAVGLKRQEERDSKRVVAGAGLKKQGERSGVCPDSKPLVAAFELKRWEEESNSGPAAAELLENSFEEQASAIHWCSSCRSSASFEHWLDPKISRVSMAIRNAGLL